MTGILAALLLLPLPLSAQEAPAAPEARAENAEARDAAELRDRLGTSLFARGELADRIIEAGLAGRFVDMTGVETHAEARSRLLDWIRRNPAKAAQVQLGLRGSGGRLHEAIETRAITWKFNPAFIESVKALNAAVGSASVSRETMELAARRLYEGPQAEAAEAVRLGGGAAAPGGGRGYAGSYADYRLDKAGLEKETRLAGAWLEALRLEGVPPAAYQQALALYQEFLVAASALKGRAAMTGEESRRLEDLRLRLRAALAGLTLRTRAAALAAAASALRGSGAPGSAALAGELERQAGELEALAAGAPGRALGELSALVNSAEARFAALYLAYSAYDGLLSLRRAAAPGYSCLLDYAAHRYLAAGFPASAYPAARAALASAAGLDRALELAGAGDAEAALAGLDPAALEAARGTAAAASAFNRAAQFFSWGLLFRPLELKVLPGTGRPAFAPAFTFFEVVKR